MNNMIIENFRSEFTDIELLDLLTWKTYIINLFVLVRTECSPCRMQSIFGSGHNSSFFAKIVRK